MADTKSLQDFYTVLKTDGVRLQNQFQLFVSTPFADVNAALENITLFADSANVPGREQKFAELSYMGYPFKVPTNIVMTQELTLDVRCDANILIRNAFLKWQSYISNPDIEGGSNLQGDKRIPTNSYIRLRLMDAKFEQAINTYKLFGAFPTNVGDFQVSNTSTEIATFQCNFVYQYWNIEENNSGSFQDLK